MKAFNNDPQLKADLLAEIKRHEEAEKIDGCTCQRCGRVFKVDLNIDDTTWLAIGPKYSAGGLLCGPCIMEAIEGFGEFAAFQVTKIK